MLQVLKRIKIKSFDRYLLRELIVRSAVSAVVCEVILLAMQAIRLANFVVGRGLDLSDIFSIFWGLGIGFLPAVLPMAFLFSALSTFSQLSAQKELLALAIMGHSPWRLARTCFFLGGVYSVVALCVSFWVGPAGFKGFEQSMAEAKKLAVASTLSSGTFSEDFLDMTFFAESVNADTGAMSKVFLQDSSSYDKKVSISASKGQWLPSHASGPSALQLTDGMIVTSEPTSDILQRIRFDEYDYYIDFQSTEVRGKSTLQSDSLSQLLAKKESYREEKKNPQRLLLELGRRLYVSLLCLLFAPLAFGVSLDHKRTAKSRALSYGIGITLGYYLFHFWLFTYLGKIHVSWLATSELPFWGLMAIPSIVTAAFGVYAFRKTFFVPQ